MTQLLSDEAKQGEKFTTLDGQERDLTDQMCMVCDAERAVDLGGIMGGLNSEIKEDTTEIILELANFNPANIRRTANARLRTEAAVRFERACLRIWLKLACGALLI